MKPSFIATAHRMMRRFLHCRSGTAAIEMALCLMVFMVAVMGVIEFGRLMWAQNALNFAVQQASRCMLVGNCDTGTAPATAASVSGFTFPASIFTASLVDPLVNAGCGHQVVATYHFSFMTNLFTYPITLTATSCM